MMATRSEAQMHRLKRALIVLLALLVLVETWIWERVGPLIRRVVAALPFEALKQKIHDAVVRLAPYPTLAVFIVPVLLLIPFKFAGLHLIASGHVVLGAGVCLLAKVVGVGLEAFLFELAKPKLMQIPAFARLYAAWTRWVAWAHALIDPVKARIKAAAARIRRIAGTGNAPRMVRFVMRYRRLQRERARLA